MQTKTALIISICLAICAMLATISVERYLGGWEAERLKTVTVSDFSEFVAATGYKTDAEFRDSGFVMHNWNTGEWRKGASWKKPNGYTDATPQNPVTQVSWNDAASYCMWKKCKLPSEKEYWDMVQKDTRQMCIDTIALRDASISNVAGNAWDWTMTRVGIHAKAVGGSYLCSQNTCQGYNFQHRVFSTDTPNNHLGFSIIQQ